MVNPQASPNETKVTSRYWAGELRTATATVRGQSLPAPGNKRTASQSEELAALSPAEQLRRKHAKTFDFKPVHQVQIKDEPSADVPTLTHLDLSLPLTDLPRTDEPRTGLHQSTPVSLVPNEPLPTIVPVPSSTEPAKTVPVEPTSSETSVKFFPPTVPAIAFASEALIQPQKQPSRTRTSREEEAIISTLAYLYDHAVTEATTDLVLRWAREAPNSSGNSDGLGIAYLQGIVARLDKHGIQPERRVVVTELLCNKLNRHLEDLKSRIGTLSTSQLPVSSSPNIGGLIQPDRHATEGDPASRPLVPQGDDAYITRNGPQHWTEQQTTSAEDFHTDHDTHPSPEESLASTTSVTTAMKSALPKFAFDVFQEAALSARRFASEEMAEMPGFLKHVRSVWRKVPRSSKADWQELFRIRKTCTDVSIRARGLLETQGLLMDFVPNYHLRAHPPRVTETGARPADSAGPDTPTDQSVTPKRQVRTRMLI